jgi:hypothetical protein
MISQIVGGFVLSKQMHLPFSRKDSDPHTQRALFWPARFVHGNLTPLGRTDA